MLKWLRIHRSRASDAEARSSQDTFSWRTPPERLFRYQRFSEWLRPVVVESKLYFPTLRELNDPCEFSYKLSFSPDRAKIKSDLQRLLGETPSRAVVDANNDIPLLAVLEEMRRLPIDEAVEQIAVGMEHQTPEDQRRLMRAQEQLDAGAIGISCLTELADSSYMSNFYAAQHTGVVLEFSTKLEPFSLAQPVTYHQQPPTFSNIQSPERMQYVRMFYKALDWAQEREWRLINHRAVDGSTKSYDPRSLVSISICPNMASTDRTTLLEWIEQRSSANLLRPTLYDLTRVQGHFGFVRTPVAAAA